MELLGRLDHAGVSNISVKCVLTRLVGKRVRDDVLGMQINRRFLHSNLTELVAGNRRQQYTSGIVNVKVQTFSIPEPTEILERAAAMAEMDRILRDVGAMLKKKSPECLDDTGWAEGSN